MKQKDRLNRRSQNRETGKARPWDMKEELSIPLSSSVNFKLDLEADNVGAICSIIQMILDKTAALERDLGLHNLEVRLFTQPPFLQEKVAQLKLSCRGADLMAESRSTRWDNAFLNAFDKLYHGGKREF